MNERTDDVTFLSKFPLLACLSALGMQRKRDFEQLLTVPLWRGTKSLATTPHSQRTERQFSTVLTIVLFAQIAPAVCQTVLSSTTSQSITYINRGALPVYERGILRAIGNRMEVPGKELQSISGTLQFFSGGTAASTSSINILYQFPGLLLLSDLTAGKIVVFTGNQTLTSAGPPTTQDADEAESLIYDSVEGFMVGQQKGSSMRWRGAGLTIKDSRTSNALSGVCSLYQLSETILTSSSQGQNTKLFCYDSGTQLLKSVLYTSNGAAVETRFSDWHTVGDQVVPGQIERLTNSQPEFILTISTLTFSAAGAVSVFQNP